MTQATRKNSPPIKVYCLPEEREAIARNAEQAGLTLSTYLLRLGVGYEIQGVVDQRQVEELARINGDLGRLGGLLKLWLAKDPRTAAFEASTVRALLARIEQTQDSMVEVMASVVRPRAGK